MNPTFWQNLHRLTHGQLFAHGHLSPRTALELAGRDETPSRRDCGSGGTPSRKAVRWPRLAIPH